MYTKKSSQLKSSLLDKIAFHAVCFEGEQVFESICSELDQYTNKIIIPSNEDHKNFLKSDVEVLQQFQKTKTNTRRYFVTNLNLRNTQVQNMLLKVVEEPSENTVIIFVVKSLDLLIPTLRSRLQTIEGDETDEQLDKKIALAIKTGNIKEIENLLYINKIKNSGSASQKQIADYLAS